MPPKQHSKRSSTSLSSPLKAGPQKTFNTRPHILVLALMDEDYLEDLFAPLMSSIEAVASVTRVTSISKARNILSSDPPSAVFAIDGGPAQPDYRAILPLLVEYAKLGGTVVLGGNFSSHFPLGDSSKRFFKEWGLPWNAGSYHRTTVHLNSRIAISGMSLEGLEASYSVKALNIKNLGPNSAVYSPSSESVIQSRVFDIASVDTTESPAVYTRIGKGYLGYTGDVNAEESTTKAILAMLHLPVPQSETSLAPTQSQGMHPRILVLALMDEDYLEESYRHLMTSIQAEAYVTRVTSLAKAHRILSSDPPSAVLAIDAGPSEPEYKSILPVLVEYVRAGGIVVLGGNFSGHFRWDRARRFFKAWDSPWDVAAYTKRDVRLTQSSIPGMSLDGLQPSYYLKALFLKHVGPDSAVYIEAPYEDDDDDDDDYELSPYIRRPEERAESHAAYMRIGNGYLGYTGDVNAAEPTTKVTMAMLHLPVDAVKKDTRDRYGRNPFKHILQNEVDAKKSNGSTSSNSGNIDTPFASQEAYMNWATIVGHSNVNAEKSGGANDSNSRHKDTMFTPGEVHMTGLAVVMEGGKVNANKRGETTSSNVTPRTPPGEVHTTGLAIAMPMTPKTQQPERSRKPPRPREAEVEARRKIRTGYARERKAKADKFKEKGDQSFKAGEWESAAAWYKSAAGTYKPLPVYMMNLAACFLKLERWEEAKQVATHAVMGDRTLAKAHYRRGLARRKLGNNLGAMRDMQRVLAIDETNEEADREYEDIYANEMFESDADSGEDDTDDDQGPTSAYRVPGSVSHVLECPSDSEDYFHLGNKKPCRFYNKNEYGCKQGNRCRFKHAPDKRSIRDELGRNVCLHWLIHRCDYDEKCWYVHDDTYLPQGGWWNHPGSKSAYQKLYDMEETLGAKGTLDSWLGGEMNGSTMPWENLGKEERENVRKHTLLYSMKHKFYGF